MGTFSSLIFLAIIALFLLGALLLGFILGWRFKSKNPPCDPVPQPTPVPPPAPVPVPPPRIPDTFDEKTLTSTLNIRLAGQPADGGSSATSSSLQKVIWVDQGDEVLVHLDSLRTQIMDRTLLVSVDLETDQTGRTPLVVVLALGATDDPAGLIAVTEDLPRGNGTLASRWGKVLQDAVWASLLGLATDHADERGLAPQGIAASTGTLHLRAAPGVSAASTPAEVGR